MSMATRRSLQVEERPRPPIRLNSNGHARANGNGHVRPNGNGHATLGANSNGHITAGRNGLNGKGTANGNGSPGNASRNVVKSRVFIGAENRLLCEALSRMLTKNGDIEVLTADGTDSFPNATHHASENSFQKDDPHPSSWSGTPSLPAVHDAEILLLSSKGNLEQDLAAIRKIRSASPEVLILLIDASGDETNFLQCIRAGVRGYLPRDAAAEDVVDAVRAIHAGKAICPGSLCAALFRYIEREATCFPSAGVHQKLGLTRREQQLIPLVAEGLTNKEIANRFCLSEQTVKNHLYRMKQKIGAEDRLAIVQVCRTQGFMV